MRTIITISLLALATPAWAMCDHLYGPELTDCLITMFYGAEGAKQEEQNRAEAAQIEKYSESMHQFNGDMKMQSLEGEVKRLSDRVRALEEKARHRQDPKDVPYPIARPER